MARQELISLLSADEGSSVKYKCLRINAETVQASVEVYDCLRNIVPLIVKDHPDNVKARSGIGVKEPSRFINKHTQDLLLSHTAAL